ncbi:MAG: WD40/YVTN/BNR-like repeat-containing protein [Saprospiraceae bacterium]
MLRLLSLAFVCAGFLICPNALFAQWEEVPSYEWREAMQIDSFQNRIFMLDDRGILYRSDNHGLRWKALQPGGSTLDEVEAFAGTGQVFLVYCASGDIWRSEDLGESWTLLIKTTPPLLNYTSSLVAVGGQFFLSNASAAQKLDAVTGQLTTVLSVPNSHINLAVTGNEIWATGVGAAPRMSPDLDKPGSVIPI